MFVAEQVAEISDRTDVSQWNHVSGINNPADIGTRAVNVDQLKRSEWLTGPAWLNQPDSKWLEQVNLEFACDEQNEQKASISTTAEKESIVQWERFSKIQPTC